jgi:UDP-glucose 6-dehydrogenase
MSIAVIGALYVDLVAACYLASSGHLVTCVRTDEARLKVLNRGLSSTSSADEFRIHPFDNGISYSWALKER